MFNQGQRVFVEGDAADICTADYTVNVSSWATVVDEPDPDDDYILLSIDEIGEDRNAWVYVLKNKIRVKNNSKEMPSRGRNFPEERK